MQARLEMLELKLAAALAEEAAMRSQIGRHRSRIQDLEAMLEIIPIGVVLAEAPSGRIVSGNAQAARLVRHPIVYSTDTTKYDEWESYHADGTRVTSDAYPLSRILRDGVDKAALDVRYRRGDDTYFWMRIIGHALRDPSGNLTGAAVALIDIDHEISMVETQKYLIKELNHRVKNAFSVSASLVSQSLRSIGIPTQTRNDILNRLHAFSRAHSSLLDMKNQPASLSIKNLVALVLAPVDPSRLRVSDEDVELAPKTYVALSMAIYELMTNAVKYGALSNAVGQIHLHWSVDQDVTGPTLLLDWTEQNGPPVVEPTSTGFGSTIAGRALEAETGGQVTILYDPTGVKWRATLPLTDEQ